MNECIGYVYDELAAAYRDTGWRNLVFAADDVNFWTCAVEGPTELNKISKALGMIVVHVREEYCTDLLRAYPKLR